MAIGWFTVLKSVPWSTVISNAPVVADGARKLWKTVANKNVPAEGMEPQAAPTADPARSTADNPSALQAQLAQIRQTAAQLEQQMLASSEVIKALAEQNAQLVEWVEANRVRTLWLTRLSVALVVLTTVAIGLAVDGLIRA